MKFIAKNKKNLKLLHLSLEQILDGRLIPDLKVYWKSRDWLVAS